ncbi:unnamed protein product [Callosobruchus maculatus]|uniref:Uncharacterized protein n=1 Tax=Callosobruchus maculatus TaxID=64391 RepID=A0A653DXT7_CALMS|nr:unnamed protein product [Callosobruchus maculatus]
MKYIGWGLIFFGHTILNDIVPVLLASLIQQFSTPSTKTSELCITSLTLIFVTLASSILRHHSSFGMLQCGIRIRAAISALVYRKILKLSQNVLGRSTSAGQIINLLSNDLSRIDTMVTFMHVFWDTAHPSRYYLLVDLEASGSFFSGGNISDGDV